jgi:hypothetical protein
MKFKVDFLPPKCGVEYDRGMVRAFTDAGESIGQPRLYSKWKDLPADGVIVWANFVWPNN